MWFHCTKRLNIGESIQWHVQFLFYSKKRKNNKNNIKDYNTYEENYTNLKKVDFLNGWITCKNKYNSTLFTFSSNTGFCK